MSAKTEKPVLWTAEEAAIAVGAGPSPEEAWCATGVSIDSRTVAPGDLFVALRGPSFDGHDFLEQAFARGAVAAVVSPGGSSSVPVGGGRLTHWER